MAFLTGKGGLFGPKSDNEYVTAAQDVLTECGAVNGVSIPNLIKGCNCLIFVKTVKVAFWGKVQGGYGIMIAKKRAADGSTIWTAPCCVNMFGAGGGFSWGVSSFKTMYVINAPDPLAVFTAMQAQVGAEVDLKINKGKPIGDLKFGGHDVQALSVASGIILDLSLAGSYLGVDDETNASIYGRPVTVDELLNGQVAPPPQFAPLADFLFRLEAQADAPPPATQPSA